MATFPNSNSDELPPYTLYDANHHVDCPPAIVERLRGFLSYCLALDYGLRAQNPDKLSLDDFCHFAALAKRCYETFGTFRSYQISYIGNVTTDDPIIMKNLLDPAQVLGIPGQVVLSMLRIFVSSISLSRFGLCSYMTRLGGMYELQTMARKLVVDRKYLFKAVLPSANISLLGQMMAANAKLQKKWFETLDDDTLSWTLTPKGRAHQFQDEMQQNHVLYRVVFRSDVIAHTWKRVHICYCIAKVCKIWIN